MKKILLLLLMMPLLMFSQTHKDRCATEEYNATQTFIQPRSSIPDSLVDTTTQYTIEVVFHIIYNDTINPAQNLTDTDVQFALDALNRDFNLQNADTSLLTDTLKDLPGNMRITFELASIDPDGNSTNGITRTATSQTSFSYWGNYIKMDSMGGKDAWNTTEYFNIWVGELGGGLLGYSQFPGGLPQWDGVVVDYDIAAGHPQFWTKYTLGRVLVHEIGHSLSLRHPWGNGWGCLDNLVADIPTQDGPNYVCGDTIFSYCNNDSTRDVVKHYMDYCGDSCMVMFTKCQVFNARKSIQEYRMDLIKVNNPITDTMDEVIPKIKIFPTITSGKVFVDLRGKEYSQVIDVTIYDMNGRTIQVDKVMGNQMNTLQIAPESSGLYNIVFTVNGKVIHQSRVIYTPELWNTIKKDKEELEEIIEKEDER
tara:strand:- start:3934 stop:5202 length:1269 start_codon:yes stop_codon:yes gene_type:complete